jgi:prepilin-type N-terminal cleavage/methylation domain-containing protein
MLAQYKRRSSGFTIVELLIVIVVIGILAAITIVAYNGIQSRAKTSSSQSLAAQIVKKAQAFYSIESAYPSQPLLTGNNGSGTANNPPEAKLDDPSSVVLFAGGTGAGQGDNPATYADGKKVTMYFCGTAVGANLFYWDYTAGLRKQVTIGSGC